MTFMPLLLLVVSPQVDGPPSDKTTAPLRIENAWVREAPPTAKVMAAYGTFCNDNETAVKLTTVSSDDFDSVEMHVSVETGNAVSMERLKDVAIGPHDCVDFAPGGRHFMLFAPSRPLRSGDTVSLTLQLANGNAMKVTLPVRRPEETGQQHNHDGHH